MTTMRPPPWLRAAVVALALVALGPWFASPPLRASAEGNDLRAADAELNETYQETLAAMPNNAVKTRLREAQRAWSPSGTRRSNSTARCPAPAATP